ncbi:hypothetical protein E2C01_094412 [Portunus trituberculatus]|uniref:Uncharacterized protein n=1 Tax=Portunus trituberculatus TaxID=210409 RepID=A0A5B7K1K8_PORTR|nr:hypothetical protein [Portunus trituberculatus]
MKGENPGAERTADLPVCDLCKEAGGGEAWVEGTFPSLTKGKRERLRERLARLKRMKGLTEEEGNLSKCIFILFISG